MPATAILRTLVLTLGLLVLSPWQAAEVSSATRADAAAACLAGPCELDDASVDHAGRTGSSDLAIAVPTSDDTSPDDACAPTRPRDRRTPEGRAISRGEPRPIRIAATRPDGPERPPKAGSHRPT